MSSASSSNAADLAAVLVAHAVWICMQSRWKVSGNRAYVWTCAEGRHFALLHAGPSYLEKVSWARCLRVRGVDVDIVEEPRLGEQVPVERGNHGL